MNTKPASTNPEAGALRPEDVQSIDPLSPMQEGMLFLHALEQQSQTAYVEQLCFTLSGPLDLGTLERSLAAVLAKYDVLRTVFAFKKTEKSRQIVLKARVATIGCQDISGMERQAQSASIELFARADRERGFDLSRDLLLRISVLKLGPSTHRLFLTFHHIILDGWCLGIVLGDLFSAYAQLLRGGGPGPVLAREARPYRDFLAWLGKQDRALPRAFWRSQLEGYTQPAGLPRRARGIGEVGRSAKHMESVDAQLVAQLEARARTMRTTVSVLFRAAWGIVLQKYCDVDDVVFGAVVSGRPATLEGAESMVGLFINTQPVRVRTAPGASLADVIRSAHGEYLEASSYEHFPLYEVLGETALKNNLFDHILAFENYPLGEQLKQKAQKETLPFDIGAVESHEETNYGLNIVVNPGETFTVSFLYDPSVYEPDLIGQVARHLVRILRAVAENAEQRVAELQLLTSEERECLISSVAVASFQSPRDQSLCELFDEQVARGPEAIAVVHGARQVTYSELGRMSERIAAALLAQGVAPGNPVALLFEPCIEMMAAILAVLRAGGAYVPVLPEHPSERIRHTLSDCGARVLLVGSGVQLAVPFDGKVVPVDEALRGSGALPAGWPRVSATDGAYLMYTSGSTGLPKASLIRQRSVTRVVKNTNYVQFDPSDRVLQLSNYAFDGSVFDIFGALLNGARLVIVDRDESRDVDRLASRIRSHGITTFFCTTSLFNVLVDTAVDALASVRAIVIGGERASPPHILRAFRALGPGRVINGYGPTETTVFATAYCVDQIHESDSFVPIGRPLANTAVFIVDRQGHLQPRGGKGEIWVGGDGVAAGYLNRPELTAERFVHTPLWNDGPVYRTGDLGRWLADGNVEYLGRNDDQVKIRGFRIEPEEVVAALNACASLRECVVVARENDIGEKYLAAYYVADESVDLEQLRKRLSERIPSYMIPSFIIRCDAIPLTANGKVNKAALPAPTRDSAGFGRSYVAPVTDMEETVAAACREIFQIDSIGTQDNFFDAGGNSILIMRLNNRLKKVLGREISIATVFQYPTVASLSAYLGRPEGGDSGLDDQDRMARAKNSLQSTVNRFARRKNNGL